MLKQMTLAEAIEQGYQDQKAAVLHAFTPQQKSNAAAIVMAAHDSRFTRRQLVAELQAELKCSGLMAGELVDLLVRFDPYCYSAFDSFHCTSQNYRW